MKSMADGLPPEIAPQVHPERRKMKTVLLFLSLFLLAVPCAWGQPEDKKLPDAKAAQPAGEPIPDGLKSYFKALDAALAKADPELIKKHVDVERLVSDLVASEIFPKETIDKADFRDKAKDALGNGLKEVARRLGGQAVPIHVKKLAGNGVLVVCRHTGGGEGPGQVKVRWWLTRKDGKWLAYDFEDLDSSMRISSGILHLGPLARDTAPALTKAADELILAMRAMSQKQPDPFSADNHLNKIKDVKLPRGLDAARLALSARVDLRLYRLPEAAKALDAVRALDADWPLFDLLKAEFHLNKGEAPKALEHLRAARRLLGDDSATCSLEGRAWRDQGKLTEAAAAFRKALDFDADVSSAFIGLLQSLRPADRRDDLVPRFGKLKNKAEIFDIVAGTLKRARDGQTLEQVAQVMVEAHPKNASAYFALAHAKGLQRKDAEAVALLRKGLPLEEDEPRRRQVVVDFIQSFAYGVTDIAPLYDLLPDHEEAFRLLIDFVPYDDREDLIRLHARHAPDDPVLLLFRGQMHLADGNYEQADKDFTLAARKGVDPEMLKRFSRDRQLARRQLGKVLGAYKIDPSPHAFADLANYCIAAKKFVELDALMEVHAGSDGADNRDVLKVRFRMSIGQEKFKEATELFRKIYDRTRSFERQDMTRTFLFGMSDAGRSLEAYRAVPDARLAYRILSQDLVNRKMLKELEELSAEHRKAHADDARLQFVAGNLLVMDKAWDKAWDKALPIFEKLWKEQAEKKKAAPDDDTNDDMGYQLRRLYMMCLARTGQAMRAYKEVPPREQAFYDLMQQLTEDKNLEGAEALLAAHKANVGETAEMLRQEAFFKIRLKRPDEAIAVFQKALAKLTDDEGPRDYVANFVQEMEFAGYGMQAYRAVADRATAFRILADEYYNRKKFDALAVLLEEHAGKQPKADAWYLCYRAAVSLERAKQDEAEKDLLAAKSMTAGAKREDVPWTMDHLLQVVRIRKGKVVEAYTEAGKKRRAFENLANACFVEKNSAQLAALLAAHRGAHPDYAQWPVWELEVHMLAGNHEAALKVLEEHRNGLFKSDRYRYKLQYLVRCLVKVGRVKEAVAEAESQIRDKYSYVVPLVLATAAGKDVKQTIAVIEKYAHQRYLVADCYRDADLGPILRSDDFRAFRERFPEPAPPNKKEAN